VPWATSPQFDSAVMGRHGRYSRAQPCHTAMLSPYVSRRDWRIVAAPIHGHEEDTHGHTWTCVGMAGLHQTRGDGDGGRQGEKGGASWGEERRGDGEGGRELLSSRERRRRGGRGRTKLRWRDCLGGGCRAKLASEATTRTTTKENRGGVEKLFSSAVKRERQRERGKEEPGADAQRPRYESGEESVCVFF
jgi:hypothetical protein